MTEIKHNQFKYFLAFWLFLKYILVEVFSNIFPVLSSPIVLLWRTRSSLRLQSQEFVSANEKVLQRVHSLEEEESAKRVLKILLWTMLFLVTKDKRSLLL